MSAIRVVAIDDHPIVLDGIQRLLSADSDLDLIGTARSGPEGLRLVADSDPDVVVLDLRLNGRSAPEVCRDLQARSPSSRVLIFTAFDEPEAIAACRRYGVKGVVAKDSGDLPEAIRTVFTIGRWPASEPAALPRGAVDQLTPRELDILLALAQGLDSRQIAEGFNLSYNTVRGYVQTLLQKMGVRNRVEALAVARRRGII